MLRSVVSREGCRHDAGSMLFRCAHPNGMLSVTGDGPDPYTAQGEKYLISGQIQTNLPSKGRPLGECRLSQTSDGVSRVYGH